MLSSTYQRVGALAGLLLVVGAWLSGYYQHWLWPVLTIGLVLVTYWVALGGLVDNETNTRVSRGFMVGVVSGVVARILGMLAMVWALVTLFPSTLRASPAVISLLLTTSPAPFITTLSFP